MRQDDAGETAAIPALLTDLGEEDDSNFAHRRVKYGKGAVCPFRLRVRFVSAMKFEHHNRRVVARVGEKLGYQWRNALFKRFNLTAIDRQLGAKVTPVDNFAVVLEKVLHALRDDRLG